MGKKSHRKKEGGSAPASTSTSVDVAQRRADLEAALLAKAPPRLTKPPAALNESEHGQEEGEEEKDSGADAHADATARLKSMAKLPGKMGQMAGMWAAMQDLYAAQESGDGVACTLANAACVDACKAAGTHESMLQSATHRQISGEDMSGTTGFIRGDEPPAERARMYVDLLLAPELSAVLMGEAAQFGTHLLGQENLMWCASDELEGISACGGLASLSQRGHTRDVALALLRRVESLTALCLFLAFPPWLAHEDAKHEAGQGRDDFSLPCGSFKDTEDTEDTREWADRPLSPPQSTDTYKRVTFSALAILVGSATHPDVGAAFGAALRSSRHAPALRRRLLELAARHKPRMAPVRAHALELLYIDTLS